MVAAMPLEQKAPGRPPRPFTIVSGWLLGLLALAAADPLWTLWRIGDDGTVVREQTGLDHQKCEKLREVLGRVANLYVEIDRDVLQLKDKPAKRVHFRCRMDGEGPE